MQININFKQLNDIHTFKVNLDDKITDIKAKIKQRYGSLIKEQKLIFNNIEIENNKKLQDYSIPNDSTLDLIIEYCGYFQIFVQPFIGSPFFVEINEYTTIKELKTIIYDLKSILPDQQIVRYHDKILNDDDIIFKSGVNRDGAVFLTYQLREPIKIFIKLSKMKEIQFTFDKFNTILDIYAQVSSKVEHKTYSYITEIFYAGINLDYSKKIKDYLIPENATLHYINYPENKIIILIKNNHDLIPIDVFPTDSVIDLKKQVNILIQIPINQQFLFFESNELEDQKQLQEYFVYSNAIIELRTEKNQKMKIYIQIPSKNPLLLEVDKLFEIKYIKTLIESITGIIPNNQRLIFQSKQLEDHFNLQYYSIKNESTVLLVPFERKKIKITVNLNTGESMIYDAKPTDFIKDIKLKITEKTGFPIEKQILIFGTIFLSDNNSLQVYSIESDVTFNLIIHNRGDFIILVKIAFNEFIPIETKNDDTIEYIKKELQKIKGISIDQQKLYIGLNELQNSKKTTEYTLSNGGILRLVHFIPNSFCVFIKMPLGTCTIFYFRSTDQVKVVKAAIQQMEGIDKIQQRLICAGRQLKDEMTLNDYGIVENSTIHLLYRLKG